MGLGFLGLLKGGTALDQLRLHVAHELLELTHFFGLFLGFRLLVLLLLLISNLDILTLLLKFLKQLFDSFLLQGVSAGPGSPRQ